MSSQHLAVHVGNCAYSTLHLFSKLQEQIEVRDHLLNVKYIKFSDMYAQVDFPSESISTVEASRIIRQAFRNSQTKHYVSGNRVFGIELKVPTLSSPSSILTPSLSTFPTLNPLPPFLATSQSLRHELEFKRQRNVQLVAKGQDLEANIKNSILQVWCSHWAHPWFIKWIGLWNMPPIFHGPDTVEHFNTISVDGVVRDLQPDAPDMYQLFQMLGRNRRSDQNTYTLED